MLWHPVNAQEGASPWGRGSCGAPMIVSAFSASSRRVRLSTPSPTSSSLWDEQAIPKEVPSTATRNDKASFRMMVEVGCTMYAMVHTWWESGDGDLHPES